MSFSIIRYNTRVDENRRKKINAQNDGSVFNFRQNVHDGRRDFLATDATRQTFRVCRKEYVKKKKPPKIYTSRKRRRDRCARN